MLQDVNLQYVNGVATFGGPLAVAGKITGLTNGSAASDAAAFGQIPTFDTTASDIAPAGNQIAGATGKIADAGHVHPNFNEWSPADYGVLASVAPWETAGVGTGATTAGTVYLVRLNVKYAFTATNIKFRVSVASAGASTGSFVGLYNSSGTLLSASADQASLSAGIKTIALGAAQALTAGTFVWIAILTNYATTQPQYNAFSNASPAIVNWDLTAANLRCATAGTGQTTLPGSFTPSALTGGTALPIFCTIT